MIPASDLPELRAVLDADFSGVSDSDAADALNIVDRGRDRGSLTGDEAFNAAALAELGALTDTQRSDWLAFCARDTIDPFGAANVAFVQSIFGAGSTTIQNLQALRVEAISRAVELFGQPVVELDVAEARRL